MQIKLDIPNKQVAEHVLWLLQRFEKDGVVIEQKNNTPEKGPPLSDAYITKNWKKLLMSSKSDSTYPKSEQYKVDKGQYLAEKYK